MRFDRGIAAAVFLSMILSAAGAQAFETTSIGGTNADGSARYQDPDEASALLSPFGSGSTQSSTDTSSNWRGSLGAGVGSGSAFGFTSSQNSSNEPSTPFNTPLLRERN
ncbi:hypothetical protein [Hyphomicrobium sp. ghe19]|uniref:hypothetical protein n=1 Tax=Hyphomicrobium sp. ghe19 TaxID=2682968 RepID=UPI0013679AE3|nr:hypothetical protein HYPP_03172 [Hyphomicrobium sp. ghe19]